MKRIFIEEIGDSEDEGDKAQKNDLKKSKDEKIQQKTEIENNSKPSKEKRYVIVAMIIILSRCLPKITFTSVLLNLFFSICSFGNQHSS